MANLEQIANAFRSERLVFRAPEDNDEDKAWVSEHVQNDPSLTTMATIRLSMPQPLSAAQDFIDYRKKSLFNLFICLAPEDDATSPTGATGSTPDKNLRKKPTPIGYISLFSNLPPEGAHHRSAMIGVGLTKECRGKGYGGEAINWALDWGFQRAGLHRIVITAFSFNRSAVSLYGKLGFKSEGVEREAIYFNRKWHDLVRFAMLEDEWEELRGLKQ